jgi:hypothetical protein
MTPIETAPAEAAALRLEKVSVKAEADFCRLTLEITTRGGASPFRDAARRAAAELLEGFSLRAGELEEYRHFLAAGKALAAARAERVGVLARKERLDAERRTKLLDVEAIGKAEAELRQAEAELGSLDGRIRDVATLAAAARAGLAGALGELWGTVYREHYGRLVQAGRQLADEVAALSALWNRLRTLDTVKQAFAAANTTWPPRLARLGGGPELETVLSQLGLNPKGEEHG